MNKIATDAQGGKTKIPNFILIALPSSALALKRQIKYFFGLVGITTQCVVSVLTLFID